MARARSVLPVPGGPTRSAPLGILPPRRENFCGLRRNSTISSSSSLASSMPATSSNVTRPCFSVSSLALDLPKPIAPPRPPPCIRFMKKIQIPIRTRTGNQSDRTLRNPDCCCASASMRTSLDNSVCVGSASPGAMVVKVPSLVVNCTFSPSSVAEETDPFSTDCTNSEYGTVRSFTWL